MMCKSDVIYYDVYQQWWAVVMKTLKYVNSLWYTYDDDDDAYLYYMMMIMWHAMMMHFYTLWWTQRWRCMTALEDDCKDMIRPWCLKYLVDDNDAYSLTISASDKVKKTWQVDGNNNELSRAWWLGRVAAVKSDEQMTSSSDEQINRWLMSMSRLKR